MDTQHRGWSVSNWTAIGVLLGIAIQIVIGAWTISAMSTRIGYLETRVTQLEDNKADKGTLQPQLDEIARRLNRIEDAVGAAEHKEQP